MTYSTTHLGIGSLLVYFFLPKSSKEYLKNHPNIFFLTSLGSILPDLDLFTNGHRAYGHSIFIPLIIMLLPSLLSKWKNFQEDTGKNIRYFGLFWLSHLLYDITFGPLALFFPVDTRFYDIQIGIVFILTTSIITPGGFFVSINIIDQRNGIDTFFVNWTAQQRISYFGANRINFPVTDFFVHGTIFIWYCLFVVIPYIKYKRGSFIFSSNQAIPSRIEIGIKPWLTAFLLILLTTSFFLAGPYHGKVWYDEQNDSSSLYILHDTMQLLGSKSYRVSQDATLKISIKASTERFPYQIFVLEATNDKISIIRSKTAEIIDSYNNQNISYIQLVNQYQSLIQENIPEDSVKNITKNEQSEWNFQDVISTSIIFGLFSWNRSYSFINDINFKSVWITDLSFSYYLGLILTTICFVLTLISVYNTYNQVKKI